MLKPFKISEQDPKEVGNFAKNLKKHMTVHKTRNIYCEKTPERWFSRVFTKPNKQHRHCCCLTFHTIYLWFSLSPKCLPYTFFPCQLFERAFSWRSHPHLSILRRSPICMYAISRIYIYVFSFQIYIWNWQLNYVALLSKVEVIAQSLLFITKNLQHQSNYTPCILHCI